MASPQVLIVGAGPSGLVLALTLVQNGIPVRIIEKNTEYRRYERGSGVQPRTLEIEYFLGFAEEILRVGLPSPTVTIYDSKDPYRIVKTFEMLEKVDPTPAFPMVEARMIGQWQHEQILRKNLEKYGYQVELGCRLESFEQNEDGVVAHLVKTKDGKESDETAKFAYIVGADGARGTVRKALGINFVGESRNIRIYSVDARLEGLPVEGNGFHRWADQGVHIVALRYTHQPHVFQIILIAPDLDFDALKTGSVEAVEAAFHSLSGRKDLKITEVISHGEWRVNMRVAEHFRVGRAFIVGDAAHVHPPTGGQGLNTSVQDAARFLSYLLFNLAWKLALALNSRASSQLLDSYESERLPVIAEMLKLTTEVLNKTISNLETTRENGAAEATEATGAEKSNENAFIRDRRLLQLDINYRWSEVVFDERFRENCEDARKSAYGVAEHDVRAGDRAPDAPGLVQLNPPKEGEKSIIRLFDLFSTSSHSALIFTPGHIIPAARDLLEPLARLPEGLVRTAIIFPASASVSGADISSGADYVFHDADGHAYKDYGLDASIAAPVAVIVRPDATIGAFARSKTGVEKYLSLVFA